MDVPTESQVTELALEYFEGAGIDVTVVDGSIHSSNGQVFGLMPLQRRLSEVPPDEWASLVHRQFEVLLGFELAYPASFEAARSLLRSAVVSQLDLGMFDGALMERPLVDGLGERLMIRRGELGMTVTEEVVGGWKVDPADVWEAARSGSLWDEPVHREEFGWPNARFTAIRGGKWTSTRALDVGRYLRPPAMYGALVAVPARDEVLVHQITDETMGPAAVAMLQHSIESFQRSPLPVGCDLFFWHDGELARIATPGEDGFVYLRVPEFSRILWTLEETLRTAVPGRG